MRHKRNWDFEYRTTENSPWALHKTVDCKMPSRTKAWKELQNKLDRDLVHSVMYSPSLPF